MRSKRNSVLPFERPRQAAGAIAYFAGEAVAALWRNGLMSLAAVTTVMVVLLTVGASLVVGANLAHVAGTLEADIQIVAFLRDDLPADGAGVGGATLPHQASETECAQTYESRWLVHAASLPRRKSCSTL